MSQSKGHSFLEACSNVFIGWSINFVIQLCLFPAVGVHIPISTNLTISLVFTGVSVLRTYVLRRLFNRLTKRK